MLGVWACERGGDLGRCWVLVCVRLVGVGDLGSDWGRGSRVDGEC